jgi:hypothetical protein
MKAEFERRNDTEVAAPAANGPEIVVVGGIRHAKDSLPYLGEPILS